MWRCKFSYFGDTLVRGYFPAEYTKGRAPIHPPTAFCFFLDNFVCKDDDDNKSHRQRLVIRSCSVDWSGWLWGRDSERDGMKCRGRGSEDDEDSDCGTPGDIHFNWHVHNLPVPVIQRQRKNVRESGEANARSWDYSRSMEPEVEMEKEMGMGMEMEPHEYENVWQELSRCLLAPW